jgi:hypothetical protein
MPLLERSAGWVANRMPKTIGPRAHAMMDYAAAASFFGMAALYWRRNQRAAVSCLFCGAAEAMSALLTDYPGGVTESLSFETHGTIDFGLAALVASVPGMMHFAGEPEARFFRLHSLALAVIAGLTDFTGTGERKQMKKIVERAA